MRKSGFVFRSFLFSSSRQCRNFSNGGRIQDSRWRETVEESVKEKNFHTGKAEEDLVGEEGLLVRDFISTSLYHRSSGYFNRHDCITSVVPTNFQKMKGKGEYLQHLDKLYKTQTEGWLTPVEIFRPYYTEAIAKWIYSVYSSKKSSPQQPASTDADVWSGGEQELDKEINILEVGGGNGTCAVTILSWFKRHHPDLYPNLHYTIVEASERLAQMQTERLKRTGHGDRVRIFNMSITDWTAHDYKHKHCFVVALEVLDNMPHDKLVPDPETGEYRQVRVRVPVGGSMSSISSQTYPYCEQVEDTVDPLIQRALQLRQDAIDKGATQNEESGSTWNQVKKHPWFQKLHTWINDIVVTEEDGSVQDDEHSLYLPTVCLQFMDTLARYMPHHHVLLADFDFLPDRIEGINAPIVSAKNKGTKGMTTDFQSYLVGLGEADIFFPTDFQLLSHMYQQTCGKDATFSKSAVFLRKYADWPKTKTRTGYNPLLQDYENTCIFTTSSAPLHSGHATQQEPHEPAQSLNVKAIWNEALVDSLTKPRIFDTDKEKQIRANIVAKLHSKEAQEREERESQQYYKQGKPAQNEPAEDQQSVAYGLTSKRNTRRRKR